jgi:acyl carrier protein
VSDILGKEVAINEPLIDAGLDSLGAVELRDAVNVAVGMELPSTVVFDYPSVGAMSGFIVSQMHPEGEAGTEILDQPVVVRSSEQRETLGVVGCLTLSSACFWRRHGRPSPLSETSPQTAPASPSASPAMSTAEWQMS